MKIKNKKWYRLDNGAKIFPPNVTKRDSKVFRFSCELCEPVDNIILQNALNKTLDDYPLFLSCLKRGLFWYYLETSSVKPIVTKEDCVTCDIMDKKLLFKVTYYKKRVNLEVHHVLTDGTGTLEFLKDLISNYLVEKHNISSKILMDDASISEKEIDSFEKYYDRSKRIKFSRSTKAYNLKGEMYPENRLKIIEGITSTTEIVKLAKKYNTTVTVYLVSILIKSIGNTMSLKDKKKSIVITVPVNLRKYFQSSTIRNFFNVISVEYRFKNNNGSLEKIIRSIDKQFKKKLNAENLAKQMNSFALLENILFIMIVPVFIKDVVLKCFHFCSRKEQTISLSNVGIVEMPKELQKYIRLFSVFTGTDSTRICICSYLDNIVLSFTSHFINSEIEKNFFRELSKNDIDIQINTNIVEDDDYEEVL